MNGFLGPLTVIYGCVRRVSNDRASVLWKEQKLIIGVRNSGDRWNSQTN